MNKMMHATIQLPYEDLMGGGTGDDNIVFSDGPGAGEVRIQVGGLAMSVSAEDLHTVAMSLCNVVHTNFPDEEGSY